MTSFLSLGNAKGEKQHPITQTTKDNIQASLHTEDTGNTCENDISEMIPSTVDIHLVGNDNSKFANTTASEDKQSDDGGDDDVDTDEGGMDPEVLLLRFWFL